LSLDKQVNLPEACNTLDNDTVLIGNIDPVSVLTFGDAASVKQKSLELVNSMNGQENFILSSGCDVPQFAPIDNIRAMISVININQGC
jgi:uroporphyrinogen decarboxylase